MTDRDLLPSLRGGRSSQSQSQSQSQSSSLSTPMSSTATLSAMSISERLSLASQLQNRLDSDGSSTSGATRMKLCEILSDILLSAPDTAMKKDCSGRLWRLCFYPQITELRNRVSKESRRKQDGKSQEALKTFLEEAIVFYQFLVGKFEEMVGTPSLALSLSPSPSASIEEDDDDDNSHILTILHLYHLYIYLGDLQRYSQSYSLAEQSYISASRLSPGRGNPYNQLAVVAQQPQKDDTSPRTCVALFWYARSLLATYEPFATSRSNVQRLFSCNRAWLREVKKAHQDEDTEEFRRRTFLAEFVEVHARLFAVEGGKTQRLEEMAKGLSELLELIPVLLKDDFLGDALLNKMVATLAFSVDYQHTTQPPNSSPDWDWDTAKHHKRLALSLALSFGSCLANHIHSNLANQNISHKLTSPMKILPSLVLLCDWYAKIATSTTTTTSFHHFAANTHSENDSIFCISSSQDFWQNIALLANALRDRFPNLPSPSKKLLKEHELMRGFKPFLHFIPQPKTSKGFLLPQDAVPLLSSKQSQSQDSKTENENENENETLIRVVRFMAFVETVIDSTRSNAKAAFLTKDKSNRYCYKATLFTPQSSTIATTTTTSNTIDFNNQIQNIKKLSENHSDALNRSLGVDFGIKPSKNPVPVPVPVPTPVHAASINKANRHEQHDTITYNIAASGDGAPPLLIPTAALLSLNKQNPKKKDPKDKPVLSNPLPLSSKEPYSHKTITSKSHDVTTVNNGGLLKPNDIKRLLPPVSDSKDVSLAPPDTSNIASPKPQLPQPQAQAPTTAANSAYPPPPQAKSTWNTLNLPPKHSIQPPPGFFNTVPPFNNPKPNTTPASPPAPSSILPPLPSSTIPPYPPPNIQSALSSGAIGTPIPMGSLPHHHTTTKPTPSSFSSHLSLPPPPGFPPTSSLSLPPLPPRDAAYTSPPIPSLFSSINPTDQDTDNPFVSTDSSLPKNGWGNNTKPTTHDWLESNDYDTTAANKTGDVWGHHHPPSSSTTTPSFLSFSTAIPQPNDATHQSGDEQRLGLNFDMNTSYWDKASFLFDDMENSNDFDKLRQKNHEEEATMTVGLEFDQVVFGGSVWDEDQPQTVASGMKVPREENHKTKTNNPFFV